MTPFWMQTCLSDKRPSLTDRGNITTIAKSSWMTTTARGILRVSNALAKAEYYTTESADMDISFLVILKHTQEELIKPYNIILVK